ncbi:SDR family NAD(P)-dependent oxidoreductase [Brevibacillus sp. NPDC003359]|uniref:SDR family NAD(P)-dependent oxidoreductase n=1 Tax=unclassified Brevibacillus TaxID=2684853 RepID=UPI0036CDF974
MRIYGQLEEQYQQMVELHQFLIRLLQVQLHSIGYRPNASHISSTQDVFPEIPDIYHRWFAHTATILRQYPPLDAMNTAMQWEEWEIRKQSWLADPNMRAKVLLADTMLKSLPDILKGHQLATDVMFPKASVRMVEGIYKHNLIADYFNEVVAEKAIEQVLQVVNSGRQQGLRILEIGAGTGGTSALLLSRFSPYQSAIQEYCYTDISKSFLRHAKKEYGVQYPYLTYQQLNIEESIADQNLAAGSYDLVVATNVLHATRNIRQTLRNTKALLKSKGVLLLNEITDNSLFNHVTFGLLKGWWLYEDQEVRLPGCPALSADMWKRVLEQEGFETVAHPASDAAFLGQQVITAISDGIVRQKQSMARKGEYQQPDIGNLREHTVTDRTTTSNSRLSHEALRQRSKAHFKKLIADILEVEADSIDAGEALEMYGMDSILIIQLTDQLNKVMAEHVSSTLFFEYSTIDALVDYFMQTRQQALLTMIGLEEVEPMLQAREPEAQHVKRDLVALEQLRETPMITQRVPESRLAASVSKSRDVAIIGLAGRYANADNMQEFWENLKDGKNCITEVPQTRWNWREHFHPQRGRKGQSYSRWGGFIRGIDTFDPLFFYISPKEAEQMDPQERQFLQAAYSSIEDAGYTPEALSPSRKVGVFVGIMNGNYPTGASYWSVANRVSYCLNFTGPSLAVDTACSSSLTAIHLALESLHMGTSDCAIAGGVNLIVDPVHYARLSEKTMLAGGDQCRAFGDQADGFVDGEGVGAIILKPLHQAEADGDHIYGVLKGSMINAGGRVKGYTVPNPRMQSQVVIEAIRRAGIDPRTISYVEAHGTGTTLGDPIEIEGLRRAFEQETPDKQFCAIGSVKTNIGHCESAAGIAGLSKILLQMQHRQLVPSLHADVPNPNIQFSQTPFYVQQELAEWKRPVITHEGNTREAPRIAGISSFGAGGANAHVIVEEYIPNEKKISVEGVSNTEPVMIVLSAKNTDRLQARITQLLAAISAGHYMDDQLASIAYTLQTGRQAMEARLAMVVCSLNELEQKINHYLAGQVKQENVYRGDTSNHSESISELAADDDMQEIIESWARKKKYPQLLELWVKGVNIDWNLCYGSVVPGRISLPAYPFAEERYWLSEPPKKEEPGVGLAMSGTSGHLHPLLQRNTSNFKEQRFSSVFTGKEFFLNDHRVNNVRVLPGAAQLEMALAAVMQAMPRDVRENTSVLLTNVVWAHPIQVEYEQISVHIGLKLEQEQEISFSIYSDSQEGGEKHLFSQGRALLTGKREIGSIHLSSIKQSCEWEIISSSECYEAFAKMGLLYGEAHRGIEQLYIGNNQVLARLSLSESLVDTFHEYALHPALIDSALQATMGFTLNLKERHSLPFHPSLPFALQRLEVYGNCHPKMWVRIQNNADSRSDDSVSKLDIELFDDNGNVCVQMKGFSTRVITKGDTTNAIPSVHGSPSQSRMTQTMSPEPSAQMLLLTPMWETYHLEHKDAVFSSTEKQLFIGGNAALLDKLSTAVPNTTAVYISDDSSLADIQVALSAQGDIRHIVWVGSEHTAISALIQVFRLVKSMLYLGYGNQELNWTVITFQAQALHSADSVNPGQAAVHGFMGSLAKEYANWKIRVVDLEADEEIYPLRELFMLPADPQGNAYVYREEEWYQQELVSVEYAPLQHTVYRNNGVYVVIGGAGGIGEAWSEFMVRTYQAHIIWIGRKEKNGAIQEKLDRIAIFGPKPVYIQADATNLSQLTQAYQQISQQHTRIDGIVHSALVLYDRSLANMDEEGFRAGLAAKTDVSLNIAHVFKGAVRDFVLLFSSLNSFLKLPGQSNYVAGCTYMDAFARQLSQEWPCLVKVMNWGYWGSVGSVVNAQIRQSMERKGIGSIEPPEANQALELLLAGPLDQIVMMKTIKQPDSLVLNDRKTVTVLS